jgi:hypothetical protein
MFIYLSEKLGPPVHEMRLHHRDFLERITAVAEDEKTLARFFATYSFLRQAFANVDDSILWPRAPSALKPCPFSAPEFTPAELKVIAEYADRHEEMDERCERPRSETAEFQ